MPDLVTHYYFADRVLEELPKDIRKSISDKNLYYFASAGPDPFFFYKFYKFKENAKMSQIGHYMHQNKVYEFFEKLTQLTKNSDNNKPLLFSYLTGFLTHHILDSTVHPYVFYKTGKFVKEDASTHIYRGLHTRLERAIDSYIIREYFRQNPNKFNIVCEILNLQKIPQELKNDFDELYRVIDLQDGYKIVNDTVKWQRKFYHFIYDPYGIKNFFFKLLDNKKMSVSLRYISYYNKEIFDKDILNLEKKPWSNPSDNTIVSTKSVLDLFNDALKVANDKITKLYNYIFLNEECNLEEVLPHTSYLNGLPLNQNEMKYFDNIFA